MPLDWELYIVFWAQNHAVCFLSQVLVTLSLFKCGSSTSIEPYLSTVVGEEN